MEISQFRTSHCIMSSGQIMNMFEVILLNRSKLSLCGCSCPKTLIHGTNIPTSLLTLTIQQE